ncbi:hypothetical protein pb186bvf_018446 [Paramecium bursaria]
MVRKVNSNTPSKIMKFQQDIIPRLYNVYSDLIYRGILNNKNSYKEFENYGVDYQLYNDITKLVKIHQIKNIILFRYVVKDDIIGLCTQQPISVEHQYLHLDAKSRLNLNDKSLSIFQEAQEILFELYKYYIKKYKEKLAINPYLAKQQRQSILQANIKDVLQLKQLTKSTIGSIFTFTLIKKNQNTYLIVYYIEDQVWKEYELKLDEQPLDIYDLALYLEDVPPKKDAETVQIQKEQFNYIYSIGGRQSELCPSTRFIRIKFPANPYTNIQAIVENLPPLPKPTERLLGGIYQNKIFIFNGSTRTNVDGRIREDFTQLAHYFDSQWKQLEGNLCLRYCGSIYNYESKYGYIGALIGGIQRVPDGRAIKYCEFQEQVEFFNYETQKLLGSVKLNLSLHSQNTKEHLTGEMLIIPSKQADKCDLITGQCLDNKKYSYNLAKNVLEKIDDYTTKFDVLYVEETVNNKRTIFQNLMDYQGQSYNGKFYVMAKNPQECYVYQINPKNGQTDKLII